MVAQHPGPTILVVEDNTEIRAALLEILDDEGFAPVGAADGAEALSYLRGGALPCVILLDLMMPTMDGWGFRAEQRRDPRLAEIPVVVLTADSAAQGKAAALDAAAYLCKPVHIEDLLNMVARFCS